MPGTTPSGSWEGSVLISFACTFTPACLAACSYAADMTEGARRLAATERIRVLVSFPLPPSPPPASRGALRPGGGGGGGGGGGPGGGGGGCLGGGRHPPF